MRSSVFATPNVLYNKLFYGNMIHIIQGVRQCRMLNFIC